MQNAKNIFFVAHGQKQKDTNRCPFVFVCELWLEDIRCLASMIYNFLGMNDIHAFGVIWNESLAISKMLCYNEK